MAELLHMPEVAANTTEAVLLGWPIPANTTYSAGDTIATVETAKAVVDVEAEADGVILRMLVNEGADVMVGDPIALIGTPGERLDDVEATLADLGVLSAPPSDAADAKPDIALDIPEADPNPSPPAPDQMMNEPATRIFASPLARRLASEAGIPVAEISGTGPRQRIVRRDVEAAIAVREASSASTTRRAQPISTTGATHFTDQPHTRARKAVAARLTESKQNTPHFYLRASVHVDRLLRMRDELNDGSGVRISVNDLVLKAVAHSHTKVHGMNVIWGPEAVRSFSTVDISVAVSTGTTLVTPVLRSVEAMSVSAVAESMQDFVERAKRGRLQQHELEGGTATVTNLGMYGTEEFAAIINPPQASILAVGAAHQVPLVVEGRIEVGTIIRLTLSVDHRPVDGTTAAEWLQVLVSTMEHPVRILA